MKLEEEIYLALLKEHFHQVAECKSLRGGYKAGDIWSCLDATEARFFALSAKLYSAIFYEKSKKGGNQ